MKPQWHIFPILAAFACLLPMGCDDSKVPLSDPAASKPDARLAGVWRFRDPKEPGEVTYYHVGRADEKLPEGVMRVVAVGHDRGNVSPAENLLVFPTVLEGKTYLNVTDGSEKALKVLREKGWTAMDKYFILRYEVDGDKLTCWIMDPDAKEKAIKAGKIQGTVKDYDIRFTDTTENLAQFVAGVGDSLYIEDEPRRMERIAAK